MSAANPNPQYNSPAEQAFVEMGSTAFKDIRPDSNRFQEIDAQYAGKSLVDMVNPDPEKNSNPENKNLFQRILVAAYAQRFVDSVKSMLNTHENSLPRKGNESYEQYACKCLSECGVTWSLEESEQSKDSQLYWDKIQSFIAAYYTSEKVQKQCNKLSRQKAFALRDLYWDRDEKEWKKEDDSRKKRKYYTQAYWAYGWLLVPNNNAARPSCPREAQLWDICHGIVTEDKINLCVTVGNEESKEFKNLKSASDILSSHADDGTLGDFVWEMKQATPGTFGTWAYDTTFVEPDKKQGDGFDGLRTTQQALDSAAKCNFGKLRDEYEGVRKECARLLREAYRASAVEDKQWKNGPNPRFLFQFLNWGDSLSAGYPNWGFDVPKSFVSGDGEELFGHLDFLPYVDFSGPTFAAVKKDRTWTPKEEWRESGCDASNSGDEDNIGNFVSATFNTPLWGGFMTDYIKGIHTPDAKKLADSFKRHGLPKDDAKLIYKAMDELTRREVCKLQEFLGRNGSDAKNCKTLLMLTTVAFNHIAAGNYNWARPWQVIRWPHHSGSGAGTFKATTLAYAYGRVERALEYVEQRKPNEAWPWPFEAVIGKKGSAQLISASDTRPSLYDWLAEGCGAGHPVLLERAMGRAGNYFDAPDKVVSGLLDDASDAALEAWKGNKGSKASKVCFASVKEALFGAGGPREWFENDDDKDVKSELAENELAEFKSWFDAQTPTREKTVDWLCGFSGVMKRPVYPLLRDAFAGLKNSGSDNKVLDKLVHKLTTCGGDAELDGQALTDLLSEQGTSADEAGLRAVKAELKKLWKELKEIAEKQGADALTAQRVLDCLVRKTVFTKEDVDAAFLLGWRSEDKLVPFLKDGEWRVPDAFDKTLMPAPKDLVSVKKELGEMRKKQG